MAKYRVTHVYAAYRDGTHYGPWTPGEQVDIPEDLAEWVGRDSPGTLTPVEEEPVAREAPPKPNRAHKGSKTR